MIRNGVSIIALCIGLVVSSSMISIAQGNVKQNTLAELKLSYPSTVYSGKATFILTNQEVVKVNLDLPVLSGSNKGWFSLMNFVSKEQIWGTAVDASKGPQKFSETKTLKPGTYRIVYEYSGEADKNQPAKWSGTFTVSR